MEPNLEGSRHLATFWVRSGADGEPQFRVATPVITIGRAAGNDLVLAGAGVAERHAEIRLQGGVWLLTDLRSGAGSWVDGEPVHAPSPLAPGSAVKLGDVILAFAPNDRWSDSEAEEAAPAPLFVLPDRRRPLFARVLFVGAVIAVVLAAYLLLRVS